MCVCVCVCAAAGEEEPLLRDRTSRRRSVSCLSRCCRAPPAPPPPPPAATSTSPPRAHCLPALPRRITPQDINSDIHVAAPLARGQAPLPVQPLRRGPHSRGQGLRGQGRDHPPHCHAAGHQLRRATPTGVLIHEDKGRLVKDVATLLVVLSKLTPPGSSASRTTSPAGPSLPGQDQDPRHRQ